ncbi:MAG: hypothetical protein SFU99_07065, partial [Saprospiraceae bacterium]|nr:hypothetical protein [Saprospiraceae bacterium]
LILGCSELDSEEREINIIETQAELYGIEPIKYGLTSFDDLVEALNLGIQFDFIYLSAHGDEIGFSDQSGNIDVSLKEFGEMLHNNNCLTKNSYLLLSCCRSGLNDVAFDLINFCPGIQFVCGPRLSLSTEEIVMGFSIFLYNIAYKDIDPVIACDKIRNSTDLRFICFDRLEVVTETAFLLRTQKYEILEVDLDGDGMKDEIIINKIKEDGVVYNDEDALEQRESSLTE